MRIACRLIGPLLSVGLKDSEALPSSLAVGRHTEVLKRLLRAVVPDTDLHDLARLCRSRYLAAESLAVLYGRLDLLHRRHALTIAAPEIVLNADTHMLAQNDPHRYRDRSNPHIAPEMDGCTLRFALEPVHPI